MIGYSAVAVFRPDEIAIWERATRMVARVADPVHFLGTEVRFLGTERAVEVRCHELVRAVAQLLSLPSVADGSYGPVDGKFGPVDHSWIVLHRREYSRPLPILDVYAVGQLPMVQLVDGGILSGNGHLYKKLRRRSDIDFDVVEVLVRQMGEEAAA